MSITDESSSITEHVAKLKTIKYFLPTRSIAEVNSIVPKVDLLIDGYVKALSSWKTGDETLQHTSDSLWDLARTAALNANRANTWDSAWDYVWKEASYAARNNYGWYGGGYVAGETARDAARDAAKYAARYIAYESAKDKMKGTNPFTFIIDLYLLGLKPTYFRNINNQEKFVVDFPLRIDDKFSVGCYAHGDGEIIFRHDWKEYCTNLTSLNEQTSPSRILE